MVSLSIHNFALVFAFVFHRSSIASIEEYGPLYLKQLGFSAILVGFTPLLGILTQLIGVPIIGYLSDKFRARRLCLALAVLFTVPIVLSWLLPKPSHPGCGSSTTNIVNENNTTMPNINYAEFRERFANISLNITKVSGNNDDRISLSRTGDNPFRSNLSRYLNLNRSAKTNHSSTQQKAIDQNDMQVYGLREMFIYFLLIRGAYELSKRMIVAYVTVAAVTLTEDDKTKFGLYACWGEIGAGIGLFIVGMLINRITYYVCGILVHGYFVPFYFSAVVQFLTLTTLPWLKFEYLEKRVVDYAEVWKVLSNPHYILLLIICCHAGSCFAFQLRWEFWYIQVLGGSPIVIAVSGLVRRPLVGLWFFLSRIIITYIGEMYTIAFALFIFAASYAGLAVINIAWLVIVCDIFQSAGYVLSYTALILSFSKAGSKASTAFIQGMVTLMFQGVGKELGTALIGCLFTWQGPRIALWCYSIVTMLFLVIFIVYLLVCKNADDYTRLPTKEVEQENSEVEEE